MSEHIKVAIRVRPKIKREKDQMEVWGTRLNEIFLLDEHNLSGKESYTFDHIFNTENTNEDVYKIVAPLVETTIKGINATIFAYGQTSSGKTHSIMGNENDLGIIPRAINNLFDCVEKQHERSFLIRASYIEIYNEKINDLLNKSGKDIKVREDAEGNITAPCTEDITPTRNALLEIVTRGNKNRQIGETNMNERSSRSHVIFKLIVESSLNEDEPVMVAHLNIVDLAGSERVAQTKATGTRLKEGGHINKSLSTLALVIRQLSESKEYISYRDSKLTRILSNSLGGNSKTVIIATITPVSIEDSCSTLNFAKCAKTIKTRAHVNEIVSEAALIKQHQKRQKQLLEELNAFQIKNKELTAELTLIRAEYVKNESKSSKNIRRRTTAFECNTRIPLPSRPRILSAIDELSGLDNRTLGPLAPSNGKPDLVERNSEDIVFDLPPTTSSFNLDILSENEIAIDIVSSNPSSIDLPLSISSSNLDILTSSEIAIDIAPTSSESTFPTASCQDTNLFTSRPEDASENLLNVSSASSVRSRYGHLERSHAELKEFYSAELQIAIELGTASLNEELSNIKNDNQRLTDRNLKLEDEHKLITEQMEKAKICLAEVEIKNEQIWTKLGLREAELLEYLKEKDAEICTLQSQLYCKEQERLHRESISLTVQELQQEISNLEKEKESWCEKYNEVNSLYNEVNSLYRREVEAKVNIEDSLEDELLGGMKKDIHSLENIISRRTSDDAKIQSDNEEVAQLNNLIINLQTELSRKDNEIDELKRKSETDRQDEFLPEADIEVFWAKKTAEERETELRNLRDQVDELAHALEKERQSSIAMKTTGKRSEEVVDKLNASIETLNKEKGILEGQLKETTDKFTEACKLKTLTIHRLTDTNSVLESKCLNLKEEMEKLQVNFDSCKEINEKQTNEIQELSSECEAVKSTLGLLQKENDKLASRNPDVEALKHEISALSAKNIEKDTEIKLLQNKLSDCACEIFKEKLSKIQFEHTKLEGNLKLKDEAIITLESKISECSCNEFEQTIKTLREKANQYESLRETNDNLMQQNSSLSFNISKSEETIINLERKLSELTLQREEAAKKGEALEKTKHENEELNKKLDSLKDKWTESEGTVKTLKEHLENISRSMQDKLSAEQSKSLGLTRQLTEVTKKSETFSEKVQALENESLELEKTKHDNEELNKKVETLMGQLTQSEITVQKLKEQFKLSKALENTSSELEKTKHENEELNKKLESLKDMWTESEGTVKTLKEQSRSMQDKLSAEKSKSLELTRQLTEVTKKSETFSEKVKALENENLELEKTKHDNEELNNKVETLMGQLTQSEITVQKLKEQFKLSKALENTSSELEKTKHENEELNKKLESLKDMWTESEGTVKTLKEHSRSMQDKLSAEKSKSLELTRQLAEVTKKSETFSEKVKALELESLELGKTKQDNEELNRKVETLMGQLTQSEITVQKLKEQFKLSKALENTSLELEKTKHENEELNEKLELLKDKWTESEGTVKTLKEHSRSMQDKLSAEKSKSLELTRQLAEVTKRSETFSEKVKALELESLELGKTKQDNEELNKKVETLMGQLTQSEITVQKLKEQFKLFKALENTSSELEKTKHENEELNKKLEMLKDKWTESEGTVKTLKEHLENMSRSMQDKLSGEKSKSLGLTRQLAEVTKKSETFSEKVKALENKSLELEKTKHDNEELNKKVKTLMGQLTQSEITVQKLKEQFKLSKALENTSSELEKTKHENEELNKKLESLIGKWTKSERIIKKLKERIENQEEAQYEVADLQRKLKKTEENVEALQQKIARQGKEQVVATLKAVEEELAEQKQENNVLNLEVEEGMEIIKKLEAQQTKEKRELEQGVLCSLQHVNDMEEAFCDILDKYAECTHCQKLQIAVRNLKKTMQPLKITYTKKTYEFIDNKLEKTIIDLLLIMVDEIGTNDLSELQDYLRRKSKDLKTYKFLNNIVVAYILKIYHILKESEKHFNAWEAIEDCSTCTRNQVNSLIITNIKDRFSVFIQIHKLDDINKINLTDAYTIFDDSIIKLQQHRAILNQAKVIDHEALLSKYDAVKAICSLRGKKIDQLTELIKREGYKVFNLFSKTEDLVLVVDDPKPTEARKESPGTRRFTGAVPKHLNWLPSQKRRSRESRESDDSN